MQRETPEEKHTSREPGDTGQDRGRIKEEEVQPLKEGEDEAGG